MISIHHLTKRFRRTTAVDDVSLHLAAGDSLALWGANGAGKTTLIRCVLGLLRFRGRVAIDRHDVRRHGKLARLLVGYVPQELAFYDDLRAADTLLFFARLKGLPPPSPDAELARVGLADHARKRVRELSGGMRQRLALAVALLGDPPVLILDEVTASLDAVGRDEFVRLLARLAGSGRTLLFASHRLDEVAALARTVAVLERGRLARTLPCAAFLREMGHAAALHLRIPPDARDHALLSLRAAGYEPVRNGVGLIVPVPHDQKAAPFRLLADARITIDDFDLAPLAHAATLPAPPTQAAQEIAP